MKNIILYLSISTILMCCTPKSGPNVFLFNEVSFKLNSGEEVVKIDPQNKGIFNSYFDNNLVQIPLFRCIKSDRYLIYVGIPFNTSVKELADYSVSQNLNQSYFEGDSTNYFYKRYQNESEHIAVYTRSFNNNLVYVLTVTNSAKLTDSLFSMKELSNRFYEK